MSPSWGPGDADAGRSRRRRAGRERARASRRRARLRRARRRDGGGLPRRERGGRHDGRDPSRRRPRGGQRVRRRGDRDGPRRGAQRARRPQRRCARRRRAAATARSPRSPSRSRRASRSLALDSWDIEGVESAAIARAGGRGGARRAHLDSARSCPRASPTPPTSTRCAPTRRAGPAACTCPVTRAAPAPIRASWRRSAREALALDIPALTWGIDVGEEPTPVHRRPAARRRGVGRAPHLVARQRRVAGKPCRPAHARPPRHRGRDAAQRALEHDRRARHVGPAADLRVAGARPRAPHRPLHDAGGARAGARDDARRGRRDGRLADLLRRGRGHRRARRGCARARRPARRRRGLGRASGLPRGPAARTRSRSAPTSSSRASTRSSAASRSRR